MQVLGEMGPVGWGSQETPAPKASVSLGTDQWVPLSLLCSHRHAQMTTKVPSEFLTRPLWS